MSSQLTVDELAARLNSFPYDRFLYIGSFMRSVAWAAGTVVLLEIVRHRTDYLPRLLPWLVSFLATMVTLMTWGRGVLFTNSRANLGDSIFPTLMGILEFCLFAILAPPGIFGGGGTSVGFNAATRFGRFLGNLHAWHFWFFVLAAHTALAVLLVKNRIDQTDIANDFDPKLSTLANSYMNWMKADKSGAWTATKASLFFGVLMIFTIHIFKSYEKGWIHVISAIVYPALFVLPILNLGRVIIDAERQRQEADYQVSQIVKAQASTRLAAAQQPTKLSKSIKRSRRHRFRRG